MLEVTCNDRLGKKVRVKCKYPFDKKTRNTHKTIAAQERGVCFYRCDVCIIDPVNSKRTGTLTQYNSPYNRMKPS